MGRATSQDSSATPSESRDTDRDTRALLPPAALDEAREGLAILDDALGAADAHVQG